MRLLSIVACLLTTPIADIPRHFHFDALCRLLLPTGSSSVGHMNPMNVLILVLVSTLPAFGQDKLALTGADDLLSWLPPDTETVVATRGPFVIRFPFDEENSSSLTQSASEEAVKVQFADLPLEVFYMTDLATPLRGPIVAYAMQGSRHFRRPLGDFEVTDFEGCSIVVFKDALSQNGANLMRWMEKKATSIESLAGNRVLVFHQKERTAEWDNFLAMPRPNVVLAANNREYLREVLQRIGQNKSPRALPPEIPEWRYRNPAALFWGLRHYDRTQASLDPTSPFGTNRAFTPEDQKAIGVVFMLDPANESQAVLTFLSGDDDLIKKSAEHASSGMEPEEGVELRARILLPAPGVLQEIFSIQKSSELSYFILNVEIDLGRGMYF